MFRIFKPKYPVILQSGKHAMARSAIDRPVLDILHRLRKNGYQAYLVGGCVRDILMGKKPKDFDIVTDARPRQIKQLFRRCYLIGKRFRLAHVYISGDRFVEVATFRASVDPETVNGGRFAANNVFGTIDDDALRRDFTVNALYYSAVEDSIVDYSGGLNDIKKKVLRSIGKPGDRYRDDPVRMIRSARFCAQLGMTLSREDYKATRECAVLIREANASRMLEELYKILRCGSSAATLTNLVKFGLLEYWLPELAKEKYYDSLTARLASIDNRRKQEEDIPVCVLVAALLYDLFIDALDENGAQRGFQDTFALCTTQFSELAGRMRLPHREWDRICNIVARQGIFTRINGSQKWKKFERRFVRNAYFDDAMLFFEIQAESSGANTEEVRYWKRKSEEGRREAAPGAHKKEQPAEQKPARKRRRRRRPEKTDEKKELLVQNGDTHAG